MHGLAQETTQSSRCSQRTVTTKVTVPARGARLEWQEKAAAIGAYREAFGYDNPTDPIGPEPAAVESPDKRALWHEAFRALGPADEVRGLEDRQLWLRCETYKAETAWAPRYVGDVLGYVRRAAEGAQMAAVRSEAEAAAAKDQARAAAHRQRASQGQALEHSYRLQEQLLARAADNREEGRATTEGQRRIAVAADSELRRPHPGQEIEPFVSAEPSPPGDRERDEAAKGGMPAWVNELEEGSRAHARRMEERAGLMVPAEDPDWLPEGEAFPAVRPAFRDAILQPPPPEMPLSARVLGRGADREIEAGGSSHSSDASNRILACQHPADPAMPRRGLWLYG